MFSYIPNTPEDIKKMLKTIGVESIDDLFSDIPLDVRLNRELNIEGGLSEYELSKHLKELSKKNKNINEVTCFLGAGAYDHIIPSVVDHISSRAEFYTAYTPYQPEISQGTLQVIFEYQTMICNITGMEVSNASMYDGATALAEAAFMAEGATRKKDIIVSKTVNPEYREVLKTYAGFRGMNVIEVEGDKGSTNTEKLCSLVNKDTACVMIQNPNFFGIIEDLEDIEKATHNNKALLVLSVDPISLGILKSPGEMGADIVVGEAQALGNSLSFGGPYVGFMATTKKLMRKMPGRIAGQTVDVDGKRAYVLTLQAREQHIRREKATSNICSNQALNALRAAVYLTTLGKKGLYEVAAQSTKKAHYAYNRIIESKKYSDPFNKPFFKEFTIASDIEGSKINSTLLKNNILGGYLLDKDYPHYKNSILYCVTEKRTKGEIDALVDVLEGIK